jgi:hypothetical protein
LAEQSGLYSAVLTAFIIESYQKLEENPADVSVDLLRKISGQLAGNSSVVDAAVDQFQAPIPAIICNVFWFLSLTLALACAFLAMFAQQWARHYLFRAKIFRSSRSKARFLQFLYAGRRDFQMGALIDIIPSFLHLSLVSFFLGLIAFLSPINHALTWIVVGITAAVVLIYLILTALPIIKRNSPYWTPLSPLAWRCCQLVGPTLVKLVNKTRLRLIIEGLIGIQLFITNRVSAPHL